MNFERDFNPEQSYEQESYESSLDTAISGLLSLDTTDNPYLADAVGFAKQRQIQAETNPYDRELATDEIISPLVQYAITTGNNQLAESLFKRLPEEEQWIMYADAQGTIDPEQLADWRLSLESGEFSNYAHVHAARLFALTQIELHNYSSTHDTDRKAPKQKPIYKARALAYKKELEDILTGKNDQYSRTGLPPSKVASYRKRLSKALTKTDLWDEIEEIDKDTQRKEGKSYKNSTKLVAKAAAGKLSLREILQLKDDELGEILQWVDTRRKQKNATLPTITQPHRWLQDQELLEELNPDLMRELPLQPTTQLSKLTMELTTGAYEEAEATYADIISKRRSHSTFPAALLMAHYAQDLQATTGAHEVFGTAVQEELQILEAHAAEQSDSSKHELKEQLRTLAEKINQLKSPKERLLATARLARIYRDSSQDEAMEQYLRGKVQRQWTTFEQQEGTIEALASLKQSLESFGMQFIKRWKLGVYGGYRGYEPVRERARSDEEPQVSREGTVIHERDLQFWEQAANELNILLGEDRYILERHETIGSSDCRITIKGTWENYGSYLELFLAEEELKQGGELMKLLELTGKLDAIFSS